MPNLGYVYGIGGDKYSALAEDYYCQTLPAGHVGLNRKQYAYILMLNTSGIAGIIVFHDFTRTTCQVHITAPNCLNRATLQRMLHYPFVQVGLHKLYGTILSTNVKARRNAEKIGFELEHQIKDYYDIGIDMCLYSLTREKAAKWLEGFPCVEEKPVEEKPTKLIYYPAYVHHGTSKLLN